MRKHVAVLAAAVMLLAACGREGEFDLDLSADTIAEDTTRPSRTAAPRAAATPEPEATGEPEATEEPEATSAPATTAPAETAGPQTPSDGISQPAAGTYVYEVSGKSTDPFNPAAGPQSFEGERTVVIRNNGNVTTSEQTSSEEAGRFTLRTRHEESQVLLLSFKAETPGGDFSCELDPPLVIARFPLKAEKYPTQEFKGRGNACDGKIDIEVIGREDAKDATGRSWSAWRIKNRLEFSSGQLTLVSDGTSWIPPELGIDVRSEEKSSGRFGAQRFEAESTSSLKSRP